MEKFSVKAQVGKRRYNVTDSSMSIPYPVNTNTGLHHLMIERKKNKHLPFRIKKGNLNTFDGDIVDKLIVDDNNGSVTEISLYNESGLSDVIIKGGFVVGVYLSDTPDCISPNIAFSASGLEVKEDCIKFENFERQFFISEKEKTVMVKQIKSADFLTKDCELITTDGVKKAVMLFFFSKEEALSFMSLFYHFKHFIESGNESKLIEKEREYNSSLEALKEEISVLKDNLDRKKSETSSAIEIYEGKLSNAEKLIELLKGKHETSLKEYSVLLDKYSLLEKAYNSVTVWSLIKSWFKNLL